MLNYLQSIEVSEDIDGEIAQIAELEEKIKFIDKKIQELDDEKII